MLIQRHTIEHVRISGTLTGAIIAWSSLSLMNTLAFHQHMATFTVWFNLIINGLNLTFGIWSYRRDKKKASAYEIPSYQFPRHQDEIEMLKYKVSVYERMIKKENLNDEK